MEAALPARSPLPEPAWAPVEPVRILVIEDDADIRAALEELLRTIYEVEVADDGVSGLEAARRSRPSLVISDLVMPGLTGIEVCRAIRADPALAHTPVIILTAYNELKHKLEGFGSGADEYLQKPFESRELLARIKALLDGRALQRELARKMIEGERLKTALKMAGALAHEINNPLSAILGFCDLAQLTLEPEHAAQPLIAKIADQARAVADAVRRIRELREVRFVPYVGAETIVDLAPQPDATADAAAAAELQGVDAPPDQA